MLIDDAGTPLIIAAGAARATPRERARYEFAAAEAGSFQETRDYRLDRRLRRVELDVHR